MKPLSAALAAVLIAAVAPPAAAAAAPSWRVDREETLCILEREGGESQPTMTIRFIPGAHGSEIWLGSREWGKEEVAGAETVSLLLDAPGAEPVTGFRAVQVPGRVFALATDRGGHALLDALPQARAAIVRKGGREILRIPLPDAAAAMAATRPCEDELLARWGVEPAAFHALKSPPTLPPGSFWMGPDDYPSAAFPAQGMVIVRLDVDAAGKVTGCAVVASSGSAPLDRATCNAARRRARYRPAIGPDGSPVPATIIAESVWHIYDTPP